MKTKTKTLSVTLLTILIAISITSCACISKNEDAIKENSFKAAGVSIAYLYLRGESTPVISEAKLHVESLLNTVNKDNVNQCIAVIASTIKDRILLKSDFTPDERELINLCISMVVKIDVKNKKSAVKHVKEFLSGALKFIKLKLEYRKFETLADALRDI
jgi:hypothetical protein